MIAMVDRLDKNFRHGDGLRHGFGLKAGAMASTHNAICENRDGGRERRRHGLRR